MLDTNDLGDCIVLRVQPLREADVIATLLHPQRGRVDAVARSARTSRKRFAGSLAPFHGVRVRLARGRGELPTLAEAQLQRAYLGDGVGYAQLALASYATELALHASQPDHADPQLYQWLADCLTLAGGPVEGYIRALRLQVEVTFLHVLGAFPDVQHCAVCGGTTVAGAVWPDVTAGLLCLTCAGTWQPRLSSELVAALAVADFGTIDDHALRSVEERTGQLLAQVVSGPLRSAAALRSLVALD